MVLPTQTYTLHVRFSRFGLTSSVKPVHAALLGRLPETDNARCLLEVDLSDDSEVHVTGFGMPFANPGHPSDGWINRGQPIVGKHTLIDILEQRSFHFVVASSANDFQTSWTQKRLRRPFSYPYGTEHHWDFDRYREMLPKTRGRQFFPAWKYDNHNNHLAAVTQSQVQDAIRLYEASQKILDHKFWACFVPMSDLPLVQVTKFYAIVPLTQQFREEYDAPWRYLTRDDVLCLNVYNGNDEEPEEWIARIVHNPGAVDTLASRSVGEWDLVLAVRRSQPSGRSRHPEFEAKVFGNRNAALEISKDK